MSTGRVARSLAEKACLMLGSRTFHSTPLFQAGPAPRRSPRAKVASPNPGAVRVKRTYDFEDSLPPIALLNSARKSGALVIEPHGALQFLREYLTLDGKSNAGWEQRLCNEHRVAPSTMALLAAILKRCPSKAQKALAKSVMLAASKLGEKAATFDIISEALRIGSLYDYRAPLERLGTLAKKENDPQAMTLLGKVLMGERREKEALDWFRRATRPPTGGLDFDGAGEALVNEGRLLSKLNDRNGARAAFEKAALELDDPSAYFYLAQLQEPGSSTQQVYLLKAASAGVTEAYHNLGALELEKITRQEKKPTSLDDFGIAREWFEVAATDGFGLSMLNMATLCKSVGQMDDALRWLEKAEGAEGVRNEAAVLKRQWETSVA